MAIHTAITEKVVKYQVYAKNKGTTLEDIIKKEYQVNKVILSEMGGVWIDNGEQGRMLNTEELEGLLKKLADILG